MATPGTRTSLLERFRARIGMAGGRSRGEDTRRNATLDRVVGAARAEERNPIYRRSTPPAPTEDASETRRAASSRAARAEMAKAGVRITGGDDVPAEVGAERRAERRQSIDAARQRAAARGATATAAPRREGSIRSIGAIADQLDVERGAEAPAAAPAPAPDPADARRGNVPAPAAGTASHGLSNDWLPTGAKPVGTPTTAPRRRGDRREVVVVVTGSREFADGRALAKALAGVSRRAAGAPLRVVEGGARGTDRLAAGWAERNGHAVTEIRADWQRHGRAAGFRRNEEMLSAGPIDLVVAFPGPYDARGTAHCARTAAQMGIAVEVAGRDGLTYRREETPAADLEAAGRDVSREKTPPHWVASERDRAAAGAGDKSERTAPAGNGTPAPRAGSLAARIAAATDAIDEGRPAPAAAKPDRGGAGAAARSPYSGPDRAQVPTR